MNNKFQDLKFKNFQTECIILDLIKFNINTDKKGLLFNNKNNLNKEFCVVKFLDINFKKLKLPEIVHNKKLFFPSKNEATVSIAFNYTTTLRKQICNYNQHSKNLDVIKKTDCNCNKEIYKDYIDKENIITGNLKSIDSSSLRDLMERGTKFRLRKK